MIPPDHCSQSEPLPNRSPAIFRKVFPADAVNRLGILLLLFLTFFLPPLTARAGEQIYRDPVIGMEFVWIPGGSFVMGQSDAEKELLIKALGPQKYEKYCACERPRHKVAVNGFWLGRYEVTNAQYRRFKADHDSGTYLGLTLNDDRQPVVNVSWFEARDFAAWLGEQCGRKVRLPTEAEWEYACRGGTATIRFWKDDESVCLYANVADLSARKKWPNWAVSNCDDGHPVTAPVGSFKANPFGLYDMLGNVWEWCADWYADDYYQKSPARNPPGSPKGRYRMVRGSSWDNPLRYVRCASRNHRLPVNRNYGIGIRLLIEDLKQP